VALAAVAAAWLVGRLRLPPRTAVAALLALAAIWPWLRLRSPWPGLLLAALVVGAWLALSGRPLFWRWETWRWETWRWESLARRPGGLAATVLVLGLLLAPLGAATFEGYAVRRLTFAPAAAALDTLAAGRPLRVAYAGWNQPYLFCGARQQNALYMVPAAPTLEGLFYRWGSPVEDPFASPPRRRVWLRNLDRLHIDVVVWTALGGADTDERRWLASTPQRFARVYGDGQVELWQIRQ
jgi:hypothetical protein